ncbi:biotin--[acetyl-CoA-carboxylase] ligase [Glycomyces albus]
MIEVTGSTNADLAEAARHGAAEGRVLVAEQQTAGRGRMDRQWECPPGAGLMMSMLLRPAADRGQWGTLNLAAAVALEETLRAVAGVNAKLKWPNDVLIDDRKVCGILAAAEDGAVVLGLGLNVSLTESELPVPEATSLLLAGATTVDRTELAAHFLAHFAAVYRTWNDSGPARVLQRWRECSATLGRRVEVAFPDGATTRGTAVDLLDDGRLVIEPDEADTEGRLSVAAGDVVHLRRRD